MENELKINFMDKIYGLVIGGCVGIFIFITFSNISAAVTNNDKVQFLIGLVLGVCTAYTSFQTAYLGSAQAGYFRKGGQKKAGPNQG